MSILDQAGPPSKVRPLKFLVFGPAKSGKTTLAGTAPDVLFLDTEGGTMAIRDKDVDVLRITDFDMMKLLVKSESDNKKI